MALLAYRGNPYSGGQGVYIRHLSRALADLGHRVDVISGQPYPTLEDGVGLVQLPSLDLYRPDRVFRPNRLPRSAVDVLELAYMCTGGFPEPLTFSLRADRWLRAHPDYDVVHDNQCLGYGLLPIAKRLPVLGTVHHAITVDRRLDLQYAPTPWRKLALRRWYGFVRMQTRVARQLPRLVSVSETSRGHIIDEFGVAPDRIDVVPVGVDADLFRPRSEIPRVPGRLLAVTSSDVPLKGLSILLESLAKLRTEKPDAHLVVIGRMRPEDPARKTVARFGLEDAVEFTGSIDESRVLELYGQAEVAVVPSLYEGFSLPAVQAMASGLPLVATKAGAIPEVAGTHEETTLLVEPGDPVALANAVKRMFDDDDLRARLGAAARRRVLERFTWERTAQGTVDLYRRVIARC